LLPFVVWVPRLARIDRPSVTQPCCEACTLFARLRRSYTPAMTDIQPLVFNPLQPGYVENPHQHLGELRDLDPVHESVFVDAYGGEVEPSTSMQEPIRRFPNARLDGGAEWNGRINLRGLEHLPVALD
jgi:hypothetical protein